MAKKTQIKGPGRPSKLTDDVIKRYTAGVNRGLPRKMAAVNAGFSESALHNWLREGREDHDVGRDTPYARFYVAAEEAEAALLERLLTHVLDGKDRKTIAWYIERRWREHFFIKKEEAQESAGTGRVVIEVPSYGSDSTDVSAASETDTTSPKR